MLALASAPSKNLVVSYCHTVNPRVDLEGVVVMRRIFEQSVVCVRTYVFCPVYADTDFPLSRDRARMLSIENIGRCVSVLTCGVVVRNGARRARSIV